VGGGLQLRSAAALEVDLELGDGVRFGSDITASTNRSIDSRGPSSESTTCAVTASTRSTMRSPTTCSAAATSWSSEEKK